MCDPVTMGITLGTTLASSALQGKAASAVQKKRNSVMDQSEKDLAGYRDKAFQNLQGSINQSTQPEMQKSLDENIAKRTDAYTKPIVQADLLPSSTGGSAASRMAIVRALSDAVTESKDRATKRADFDAYGDATFNRDIALGRNSQGINQSADFARGRTGVTELELVDANTAGSKYANLAGIVSALGTVASAGIGGFGGTPSPERLLKAKVQSPTGYSAMRMPAR